MNVFVAEYTSIYWYSQDYQVIGVCDSLESAQEFVQEYLHLEMKFMVKPMSLVCAPELHAWKGINIEHGFRVQIYETAVISKAPAASADALARTPVREEETE